MDPAANQRVSPNRVVLILALLLAVWLGFQFYPRPAKPTPPMTPVMAESRLRAVGLADNPDWEGLPEFFAIVADKAEWKEGRTQFAYWHPVMKTYSYYFEAMRDGGGIRFREIPEPHDQDHGWDENTSDVSPIRFYFSLSPVHPAQLPKPSTIAPAGRSEPVKVKLEVAPPKIPLSEAEINQAKPATKP